jgi:hypothetical protein
MNKTKRTDDYSSKNHDDEEEEGERNKASPIIPQPGVNTSSFLAVPRDFVLPV